MTGQGRPIRFLALVVLGWIGVRIALLWSATGSLPEAIRAFAPIAATPDMPATPTAVGHSAQRAGLPPARLPPGPRRIGGAPLSTRPAAPAPDPERVQMALMGLIQYGVPATIVAAAVTPLPPAAQPENLPALPSHWSASAWLVARPGTGLGAAPGASQLGGSQAGLRVAWLLWPRQRLAGFGRLVTPLRGKGAEASIGLEWQPTRAPVRVVAEQRFGLDGIRGGPGLGVAGGFEGTVGPGFRLETYGQAGAIRRLRTEAYADGAVRVTRTLAEGGGERLALGGGAWAAAQRDATRLDIGPSATLALPLGKQNVRLVLDWRQRVAGTARPGSGFALTLGSDF
ncbi:hypothetical protein [Sphingomonas psychrotolerans]|uniref:Uncharacterized protein n=1 Tax=Sphingomonas psychrotolerans TaxID=1327635 RepID=A0A2K8MG89_9SPHN|nr:hypothetical protein [Sphingomonas psychrotolerans]ATY32902.1 hypothetical protein CVN68_13765 [Sphingomonas psychrotolerans]